MKRNTKIFWRSFFISLVLMMCFLIIVLGICESYKQIRRIGFNEYKNAVGFTDGEFYILDFTV